MPEFRDEVPGAEEYRAMRRAAGLNARTAEAAAIGLPNSLHAICVREDGRLIGMGRVIGDGGTFAQITDIAVLPEKQGQGIGHEIVARLVAWCNRSLPASCYLSLIADPPADRIYAKFGFDHAVGMGRTIP